MKITIFNTGGTFNKRYNPIIGNLEVPSDNTALDEVLSYCYNIDFELIKIISKDSLDIVDSDRQILVDRINKTINENIIIVHGTDTINQTAIYLEERINNKKIVLTGSMVPFSINKVEATLNIAQAIGFLNSKIENSVYISMHGVVENHRNIFKNKKIGQFEVRK